MEFLAFAAAPDAPPGAPPVGSLPPGAGEALTKLATEHGAWGALLVLAYVALVALYLYQRYDAAQARKDLAEQNAKAQALLNASQEARLAELQTLLRTQADVTAVMRQHSEGVLLIRTTIERVGAAVTDAAGKAEITSTLVRDTLARLERDARDHSKGIHDQIDDLIERMSHPLVETPQGLVREPGKRR